MLRVPGSYYENKRSNKLLKYKKFKDDEARVVGHELGTGKYSNVMGKLIVEWIKGRHKGTKFRVGSGFDENQRHNYKKLFPKGSVVTVKYFEINETGKPRFPVFLGLRNAKDL